MNNKNTLTVLKNDELNYESYIVFCLNSKKYAINIRNVIEVINMPLITMPVVSMKSVIGMFYYNGMIIKAVDICSMLGIPVKNFSVGSKFIILVNNGNFTAVNTEYIENIIKIDIRELNPFPFDIENSIISNVYKYNDTLINIIDVISLDKYIEECKSLKSDIDYNLYLPNDENSLKILNDRASGLKKNSDFFSFPDNPNTACRYIMFDLDNHGYFLDIRYVKEFVSINTHNITALPYAKKFIKGIAGINGEFLVVLDLKCFLNNECTEDNGNAKIIVAKGQDFNIALLVDDIKYIKTLKQHFIADSGINCSKYISAEFEENGILYSILNFERIINDENIFISC